MIQIHIFRVSPSKIKQLRIKFGTECEIAIAEMIVSEIAKKMIIIVIRASMTPIFL